MTSLDASTGLTCVACRLVFKSAEVQREHYKTDWHRYNLKRQVADLPPVTDEQFVSKVLTFRAEKEAQAKEEEENSALYCACCKKQLKSKNAFDNHIASKKHKEMEKQEDQPKKGPKQPRKLAHNKPQTAQAENDDVEMEEKEEENEEEDSEGWETDNGSEEDDFDDVDFNEADSIPVSSCLFCPQTKSTFAEAQEHMRFHHGFNLPDKKYLEDEEGLMKYLGLKVGAGRCCIFCPDMRSRFATISACQAHMRDKEHCKLPREPERMLEFAEYYDLHSLYKVDEEGSSTDAFYDDVWTLTLPSGAKIGHRSLMLYYRQYLRPVEAVKRDAAQMAIDRARGLLPALAWTNTKGVAAKQVARDLKFVQRYRRRFDVRVACRSNKLFKTGGRVGDN